MGNDTQLGQVGLLMLRVAQLATGPIVDLGNQSLKPLYVFRIHPEFKETFAKEDLERAALNRNDLLQQCRQQHFQARILERFLLRLSPDDVEWRYFLTDIPGGLVVTVVVGAPALMKEAEDRGLMVEQVAV